jgi:hypothetical protein
VADLILAVLLLGGATGAAELVRSTCRRQLLTPVRARSQEQPLR